MSTRTTLRHFSVITDGNMAGNLTSLPTILQSLSMVSFALRWSGTAPIGTVSVQVSNDFALAPDGSVANAGTWTTVTLQVAGSPVTSIPVTGNTGTGFIDMEATAAYAVRLIYTAGSGTGALNAIVVAKVA